MGDSLAATPRAKAQSALDAGYTVRPMQLSDVDVIAEVHVQVWREAYVSLMPSDYLADLDEEQFARSWRVRLEEQESAEVIQLVGLSPDGQIVAIGSAGPSRDEDAPRSWELLAINVLAAAQGTGLADLMMAELVGDRPTSLWVLDGNKRAQAFYAHHGFIPDGATTEHEPSGRVELRLVRN
jgi:GNAT superfamily N-acetyltransferase